MTDYWKKRQNQLNKALEKDEAALKKRLTDIYQKEERKLEKEIASYYASYGKDNVVEYRQLLQQLSDADKRLLMERMDDFAKKYPEYAHLMPVRESVYRLDRLEGLEYSVQMQQLELGIKEQAEVEQHLLKQAERGFGSVREDLGLGTSFNAENKRIMQTVVETKWSQGKNFSDRIWASRTKLANTLNSKIAAGFARGDNYEKLARELKQRFSVSRSDAMRLIYTEGTFVMNESRARAVEETFDYYQLSCLPGACDVCLDVEAEQEAEPAKLIDRSSGDNFPPLHPWGLCGFIIVVPDPQKCIDDYAAEHGEDVNLTPEQRANIEDLLKQYGEDLDFTPLNQVTETEPSEAFTWLENGLKNQNVKYNEVADLPSSLTTEQIVNRLAGGDMTGGSCSSLGFSYIGNKNGLDVLDFRGGKSREFFSRTSNIKKVMQLPNVKGEVIMVKREAADTAKLIQSLEYGKEYYLAAGKHAAIVRNTEAGAEFLELQSHARNGWTSFDSCGSTVSTLRQRFGCRKTPIKMSYGYLDQEVYLMEVDSFKGNQEFRELMGYINTAADAQKKGMAGGIK